MITPNLTLPLLLLMAIAKTDQSSEAREYLSIIDVPEDADRNFAKDYFGSGRIDIEPGKYVFFYTGKMTTAEVLRFVKDVSLFPDYALDVSTEDHDEFVLLWKLPDLA